MKRAKPYILGTLLTIPISAIWYHFLLPPQCPMEYTQAQIDTSNCVIGANIGGPPLFLVAVVATWFATVWLMKKLFNRHGSKE